MSCDEVALSLPWYLNGSLEEEERSRISEHLKTCAACRAELEETLWLSQAIAEHSTHSELISLARDQDLPNRLATERHVEICPSCNEKLQLIELMTSVPEEVTHEPAVERPSTVEPLPIQAAPAARSGVQPFWRAWALAATVLLALGSGLFLQNDSSNIPRSTEVLSLDKQFIKRDTASATQVFDLRSANSTLTFYYPLSASHDLSQFDRFTAMIYPASDPENAIWQHVPWQPDLQGTFALALSSNTFELGKAYQLDLFGWEADQKTLLESLPFSLRLDAAP